MKRTGLIAAAILAPGCAWAHTVASDQSWIGPEPWMLVSFMLAVAIYAFGAIRLRGRARRGRPELARQARLFTLGCLILAGATLSPLHQLGGRSFTAHMLEHELIMLAAAPFLVLAQPLGVMLWAFPVQARRALGGVARGATGRGLWRTFSHPLPATALQAASLWLWHLPSLFDRALKSEGWHAAQHLSFLVTALLFWTAMLGPRRNAWTAAACLFITSMATGALGAFMALSQSPWYGPYAALGLAAFGLTPAEDQQLAGALMWAPGGLIHAIVAISLIAPHLRAGPVAETRSA